MRPPPPPPPPSSPRSAGVVTVRRRLTAVAAVTSLLLAGAVVVLLQSRTADCGVAVPRPVLPPELRALGDFDQSYDVANVPALQDAAARAASALHADLIGTIPEAPVTVIAARPGSPDAVVVPLRANPAPAGGASLAGLVVFLRDCQGNAYFNVVEDDAARQPALQQFPPVSSAQAAAQLLTPALALEYVTTPLAPQWVSAASPARSMPAR